MTHNAKNLVTSPSEHSGGDDSPSVEGEVGYDADSNKTRNIVNVINLHKLSA
jgi:hypothetical protein